VVVALRGITAVAAEYPAAARRFAETYAAGRAAARVVDRLPDASR
jgi:hypothetical protein